jgi:anti-sigma factor RsiW
MKCDYTHKWLFAFADGELDVTNHLKIEQHLQDCDSCSRILENQTAMKAAFDNTALYFQAQPNLKKRVWRLLHEENNRELGTSRIGQWHWWAIATALTCVAIIAGLMYFQPRLESDETIAEEIVSVHIRSQMAEHLTDVQSSDEHTVKPWFEGKLDFSPPVFNLDLQGWKLIGGRHDYVSNRPLAAIVYQRRQHIINLLVYPSKNEPETENKTFSLQGYNLVYWKKSGMTFWAISDLNSTDLQEFSNLLKNQS